MSRHLIHIGYPKTGSTFLQKWFASHPRLAFRESGLAGFRDVYTLAHDIVTSGQPAIRVTSSERLSSPNANQADGLEDYASKVAMRDMQAEVCRTLAAVFSNAMILIVTRGFRGMILSSYSQYVRTGGEADLPGFFATLADHPWDYDAVIAMYVRAFGAENVIVMPYELLRDDSDAFLRELSARLQLEPVLASRERVNVTLTPAELYWYPRFTRLVRRFAPRPLLRRYAGVVMDNRLRWPIRALAKLRTHAPLTVPDAVLEQFRGRADSLRGDALYAPYAADYLF